MTTDLHIHTCYSTGTQPPEEAIQEALAKGLTFISFTDDDTMDTTICSFQDERGS